MQSVWKRLRGSYLLSNPDLLVICLGVFVTFLGMGVVLPVRNLYAEQTGSSPTEIGWMTAAFFGATFLFLLPCGWLTDRFGRKLMLASGLGVHGVVAILYLFFTSPWAFIGLRFVEGIGAAGLIPAARAYLGDVTPPERRGEAYGAFSAAISVGLLIGPGLGSELALFGYPAPFLASSAMAFTVVALSLLRVDDTRVKDHLSAEAAKMSVSLFDQRLLKLNLWGPMALTFGRNIALGLFNVLWSIWMHDLAVKQGLSETAALSLIGLSYTCFALPQLFLQPLAGRFADRHKRALLILIPGLLLGVVYTIYGLLTSLPLICLFAFAEGTLVSFFQPATDSYLIDVSPEEARGLIQGLFYAIGMVGGFASAIITPTLYRPGGIHRVSPFIFLAITTLITTFIGSAIVARFDPRKKWRPKITPILTDMATIYSGHAPTLNGSYHMALPEEDPSSELLTSN
ncbi:MAG TPA: MFS transporter [Ktedonobacterales bacterium]|jgi:DHA1 family multidrug resistance protein-like MFS transporter